MGFGLVNAGTGKDVGKLSQIYLCTRLKPVNLFTMQVKCSVYWEPYLQYFTDCYVGVGVKDYYYIRNFSKNPQERF